MSQNSEPNQKKEKGKVFNSDKDQNLEGEQQLKKENLAGDINGEEDFRQSKENVNSGIKIKSADSQNLESGSETFYNSGVLDSNATPIAIGSQKEGDTSEIRKNSDASSSESLSDNFEKEAKVKTQKKKDFPVIEIFCILIILGLGISANYILKYYIK